MAEWWLKRMDSSRSLGLHSENVQRHLAVAASVIGNRGWSSDPLNVHAPIFGWQGDWSLSGEHDGGGIGEA